MSCLTRITHGLFGRPTGSRDSDLLVNDIHSKLNPTRVAQIIRPGSLESLRAAVRDATKADRAISISGGRHAMGGQQFGMDTTLIDMNGLRGLLALDTKTGIVEVE